MRGIIWLVAGIIFIGAGVFVYFVTGTVFDSMPPEVDLGGMQALFQYGMGGLFAGIGVIMALGGVLGIARGSQKAKLAAQIAQVGTETEGTVTFVDRNYSLLVNNQPIYSIVEYTYKDGFGNEHTNRIENVSTEHVIRNKIEVGGKVRIKYLPGDPSKSGMIA